jgi:hypothetical protein
LGIADYKKKKQERDDLCLVLSCNPQSAIRNPQWKDPQSQEPVVDYPRFIRIRQQFERPRIDDLTQAVSTELDKLDLSQRIRPGQTVALTAGSRGIANIPEVLRATAQYLRGLGAQPFLVPTMGSHGGGTAEGQRKILESYGITEAHVGIPIRASMEVVAVGTTPEGFPVFLDRQASEADHIGVVARIKPHTAFHGPIESGLLKMMLIGLGKHQGALVYHRILLDYPFDQVVRSVTRTLRQHAPISFGLGIVENAYDETALLEGISPDRFEAREEVMLSQAKALLARLPLRQADLLIVDEIGKNISGSGMDTNVVGRKRAFKHEPTLHDQPQMRLIFVRGLTEKTHGNAAGIGLADFTTTRLVKTMDYRATVINCLTAGYPDGANLPVYFDTDREVLEAALAILGTREPKDARILRIRNTLELEHLDISEPCLDETDQQTSFTPLEAAQALTYDSDANLFPL